MASKGQVQEEEVAAGQTYPPVPKVQKEGYGQSEKGRVPSN